MFIKRSTLQRSVSNFTPKQIYELGPRLLLYLSTMIFALVKVNINQIYPSVSDYFLFELKRHWDKNYSAT